MQSQTFELMTACLQKAENALILNQKPPMRLPKRNRDELVFMFQMRLLQVSPNNERNKGNMEIRQSFVVGTTHTSAKHLNELKPITFSQMQLPKVHYGSYLLCRTITPSYILVGTSALVEDINGDVQEIAFYNLTTDLKGDSNTYLPKGTTLVIKEPYMKYTSQEENWNVRIESPTDVIFVDEMDDILKNTPWQSRNKFSFDDMKARGNKEFVLKNYKDALKYYNRANKLQEDPVINLNKAATLLQLERYSEAYSEAQKAFKNGANQEKSLYRLGKAAYGMGKWSVAIEHFTKVLEVNSGSKEAAEELNKSKLRLAEAQHGQYDFVKIFKDAKMDKYKLMDVADYNGPIDVCGIEGKDKGVIATEDIKKGTLLIGSKAFSYTVDDKQKKGLEIVSANLIVRRVDTYSQAINIIQTCLKLKDNPGKAEQLYSLYAGEGEERNNNFPDGIVDAARISKISTYNSFGVHDPLNEEDAGTFTGLWIMPSFINHSCVPNASYLFYGDFMTVSALRDIRKGEEITVSYAPLLEGLKERERICSSFGFTCDCVMCKLDRSENAVLYQKRQDIINEIYKMPDSASLSQVQKKINKLKETFENRKDYKFQLVVPLYKLGNANLVQIKDKYLLETIKICKEAIEIIGEHCIFVLVKLHMVIFQCYHMMGKLNDALLYLKNSVETFNTLRGIGGYDHKIFALQYAEELKGMDLEFFLERL